MTPERLKEIKERLASVREEHRMFGRVTFTVRWDMAAMDELIAEVERLWDSKKTKRRVKPSTH